MNGFAALDKSSILCSMVYMRAMPSINPFGFFKNIKKIQQVGLNHLTFYRR